MTEEQKENMKRDAFHYFYDDRSLWKSYKDVYDFLESKGHGIHNQGEDLFKHNDVVTGIFNELVRSPIYPSEILKHRGSTHISIAARNSIEIPNVLYYVPYFKSQRKNKDITDIYVISLEHFHKNWLSGVSYLEYCYFIRIEQGLNFDDVILTKIYTEIIGKNVDRTVPALATIESIFRLLEYQELQESFKQSKEAKIESTKAFKLAMYSLGISAFFSIVAIVISVIQMKSDVKIDTTQYDGLVKARQEVKVVEKKVPVVRIVTPKTISVDTSTKNK